MLRPHRVLLFSRWGFEWDPHSFRGQFINFYGPFDNPGVDLSRLIDF